MSNPNLKEGRGFGDYLQEIIDIKNSDKSLPPHLTQLEIDIIESQDGFEEDEE